MEIYQVAQLAISATPLVILFISWLKGPKTRLTAKKQLVERLFGFVQDADETIGTASEYVKISLKDTVPPDDQRALELFADWLRIHFRRDRPEGYLDEVGLSNSDKSLVSIGGPVSHWLTRHGMGYDRKGEHYSTPLPYIYPLREAELQQIKVQREWCGRRWIEENWYIAESKTGKPIWTPRVENGILKNDFLMIIVIPNTLSEKAFSTGQKHLMVASAHGIAQMAIKNALDDNAILEELERGRKGSEFFQAVIGIPQVKRTKRGYLPAGKPFILDVKPLGLADFKVVDWNEWWS